MTATEQKNVYYIGGGLALLILLYLLFRKKTSSSNPLFDALDKSVSNPLLKSDKYLERSFVSIPTDEVRLLQTVINARLDNKESRRKRLVIDGIFGAKTNGALIEVYGKGYFDTKEEFEKFTQTSN